MANYDIPQVFALEDTNTGVIQVALDEYFDCRDFSIFDPAGCQSPHNPSYCFPFTPQDFIFIQVNSAPALVEFFELDGTPQIIPYTLTGKTLIIDGADVPSFILCFFIKLDGVCTYTYTREECPDQNTITLESTYLGKDPLGFDYTGDFRNYARVYAGFEFTSLRNETTATSTGRLVSQMTYERFTLRSQPMPADVWRYYLNILSGARVKVNGDGHEYNLVSIADRPARGLAYIDAVLERSTPRNSFC